MIITANRTEIKKGFNISDNQCILAMSIKTIIDIQVPDIRGCVLIICLLFTIIIVFHSFSVIFISILKQIIINSYIYLC